MGGLAAIALDRAQALEEIARQEANKESERLRNLILDSMTHELRTPLTSVKAAAGTLLLMDEVSREDQESLLRVIDEEANRMNRLIGQAVEMAQLEAREVKMDLRPVSLDEVLEQVRESAAWVWLAHPVAVELPELPQVLADPVLIAKVLNNLLENAAKYSDAGSPIRISACVQGAFVVTRVADQGVGVEVAEQKLIFERLYRSKKHSQKSSGTGMGLPISRAIIESHEGVISMESVAGDGSVFQFSLPIAVDRMAADESR